MKELVPKASKTNSSNKTSSNTRSDQDFASSSSRLFGEGVAQKKEASFFEKTPSIPFFKASQSPSAHSPVQKQSMEEEEVQMKAAPSPKKASPARKENNTGLPETLKTGMENLSGMSLDDVKVHRNSDKPAGLQAYAYAQGTDIHLGPGQEKHLPHEAWHVVQQKQGRVKPTMQMSKQSGDPGLSGKSKVDINDDSGLENEADVMGKKSQQASQLKNQITQTGVLQKQRREKQLQLETGTVQLEPKDAGDLPDLEIAEEIEETPGDETVTDAVAQNQENGERDQIVERETASLRATVAAHTDNTDTPRNVLQRGEAHIQETTKKSEGYGTKILNWFKARIKGGGKKTQGHKTALAFARESTKAGFMLLGSIPGALIGGPVGAVLGASFAAALFEGGSKAWASRKDKNASLGNTLKKAVTATSKELVKIGISALLAFVIGGLAMLGAPQAVALGALVGTAIGAGGFEAHKAHRKTKKEKRAREAAGIDDFMSGRKSADEKAQRAGSREALKIAMSGLGAVIGTAIGAALGSATLGAGIGAVAGASVVEAGRAAYNARNKSKK